MHDNLIILAGGASSRMKKQVTVDNLSDEEIAQANERSKGLIGVGPNGRPLLDYLLLNAKKAGYKNIYIIIGERGDLFKEFYGSENKYNDFHGLTISFAIQYIPEGRAKPLGTADALFQAVEQYPELNSLDYSVCNSDNLYSVDALYALRETDSPNAFISYNRDAMEFPSERISRFAIAKLDHDNQLFDILEKPTAANLESYKDSEGKLRVSMNAFKFKGDLIYPYLKNCPVHPERDEKELPTVLLNALKEHPNTTFGIPFSEHVPDLTAKEDIAEVKAYLKKQYPVLNWND
ncbi:nucleotidyltransferase [Flavobacterium sp. GSP27]|uniref:sugar phosphate nucleotidyltransferase n=1 Tax=unclassified Flavobacterium TaxID=196869 RepID=UPI000F84B5C0|nr:MULTISPECIES: sugar phosphate nucleotidyltransferase [unclassified Flavobacterium]RTY89512.1 nucleotidyltransferase [Flavobacterium sp. GSN2]RTY78561.1 nucleotidyltransferase [Flavobacterium sp. LS1P28]RTY84781.1 nucleotidyltransferase [Flavobacterium sp. ZB4P23]RTY87443.1 nucleotidyltransferase [Flavobacterium sp. RSP15]RTZ03115.1 nucleotidyltransferase [Flavobacterium sp. GSP6]